MYSAIWKVHCPFEINLPRIEEVSICPCSTLKWGHYMGFCQKKGEFRWVRKKGFIMNIWLYHIMRVSLQFACIICFLLMVWELEHEKVFGKEWEALASKRGSTYCSWRISIDLLRNWPQGCGSFTGALHPGVSCQPVQLLREIQGWGAFITRNRYLQLSIKNKAAASCSPTKPCKVLLQPSLTHKNIETRILGRMFPSWSSWHGAKSPHQGLLCFLPWQHSSLYWDVERCIELRFWKIAFIQPLYYLKIATKWTRGSSEPLICINQNIFFLICFYIEFFLTFHLQKTHLLMLREKAMEQRKEIREEENIVLYIEYMGAKYLSVFPLF